MTGQIGTSGPNPPAGSVGDWAEPFVEIRGELPTKPGYVQYDILSCWYIIYYVISHFYRPDDLPDAQTTVIVRDRPNSSSLQACDQVCDQDSVMEFGLDQLRTGLRLGSSRFQLSRHVEIARTCSNLVADRFEAKFNLRYPGRRQVRSWSQTC